ncbi:MAG TPA: 2-amino-4-hydroxy-6-hydroxymethyldihydropteridine diphosphokinase [Anaerolineales bacterium]|nr:2-amino-4-hydroxy-6-hydroxymethyldihydropteridine diphosphokinase [Anaerolineales bacterium]
MATVFIALGSNLGKRDRNLAAARRLLAGAVRMTEPSSIIETEPWGYTDQPAFLNQVVRGETDLAPAALLAELKSIERRMGRTETFRFGPRLIDLDLLYYDDLVIEQPGLSIPHPRLHERVFVLRPLAEIAPGWIHPVSGQTHLEMLHALEHGEWANGRMGEPPIR